MYLKVEPYLPSAAKVLHPCTGQVCMWLCQDIVASVPFFKDAEEGFTTSLVTLLRPQASIDTHLRSVEESIAGQLAEALLRPYRPIRSNAVTGLVTILVFRLHLEAER